MTFTAAQMGMPRLKPESVDLIVTSPPYPMIDMWDECFSRQSPCYLRALQAEDGPAMHQYAHRALVQVWDECARVLKPGGMMCINIGDAVRNVGGKYRLYSNTAPIQLHINTQIGLRPQDRDFAPLPSIIWRKPSNSPTKFLGSGMLPTNAYVTMEHEYILIFRKGERRQYEGEDKTRRRWSAIFWEERNAFFSDLWTFPGYRQEPKSLGRFRTGAFPAALPERLIAMFSLYGDVVLDPFMGTGTTQRAAMALGRNSLGFECKLEAFEQPTDYWGHINVVGETRLANHQNFVAGLTPAKDFEHRNEKLGTPVKSPQERDLVIMQTYELEAVDQLPDDERELTVAWEAKHAGIEVG